MPNQLIRPASPTGGRGFRSGIGPRARALKRRLLAAMVVVAGAVLALVATAAPASAHVVPSTVLALDVHEQDITATLTLPTADLITASGVQVPTTGTLEEQTAQQIRSYLQQHFAVTTSSTDAASGATDEWTVTVGEVGLSTTDQWGTGSFSAVTATATLTPTDVADVRIFTLDYDAIVHQVITADVFVLLAGDDATADAASGASAASERSVEVSGGSTNRSQQAQDQAAQFEQTDSSGQSVRTLGAIKADTATGTIPTLTVDLDASAASTATAGFLGMLTLGISHIAEGTDHQLFLLTLLLPAPLIAMPLVVPLVRPRGTPTADVMHRIGAERAQTGLFGRLGRQRRWSRVAPAHAAVRRITTITLAFTVGHSITLALGAAGLPVPQQPIEALIAVSILIAALHAIRPLFPGREPYVAGFFGLIHGLAFSTTLSELNLSGAQLVLSLLGFNVGIEIMQLAVVLLVLPPLIVLARTRSYPPLRVTAAVVTGLAAAGWLLDRVGYLNPLRAAADHLGPASPWIAAALWIGAVAVMIRRRGRLSSPDLPQDDDRRVPVH